MKLKELPKEEDGFRCYAHDFCGLKSYLIIPEIDAKWTKDNLHFRSMIVSQKGYEIFSASFKKFFNTGEKPELYPSFKHFEKDCAFELKKDGSTVIVDYVNGQFSMRTRGSVSYKSQKNFEDFELLPKLYPKIVDVVKEHSNISFLLEIETPNNVIVIRPDEVKFTLLSAIDKNTLNYLSLEEFKKFSQMTEIPMTEIYQFDSLEQAIEQVKQWKGREGIVLSYNNNQNRIKIKSDFYLYLHRIKSQLNSTNNLIEFYVEEGLPSYQDFYQIISTKFDFELAEQMRGEISKLADTSKTVAKIIQGIKDFVNDIRNFPSRKEQATAIINSYGGKENNRASMVFNVLDGKELSKEQLIKLMHQNYC